MKSVLSIVASCIILSGCASTYTYDGSRYQDKNTFNSAVEMKLAEATAGISPLSSRVSKKTLVFAIPSEDIIIRQAALNFSRINGRTIGLGEEIMARPVWSANYKGLKAFYDAIVRRNIYQNVRYVEMDTVTVNLQPTTTEDVFFYSEAQQGVGQWYYASEKAGKQAFAYDRGVADMQLRTKSFIDAIQVYAIRD